MLPGPVSAWKEKGMEIHENTHMNLQLRNTELIARDERGTSGKKPNSGARDGCVGMYVCNSSTWETEAGRL
jgi:hypothetical protein